MSSVKTLRLTKLGRVTSLPIADVHFGEKPTIHGFIKNIMPELPARTNPTVDSLREGMADLAIAADRARKSADGAPLGFLDKVREFLVFNAPKSVNTAIDFISRAKLPILATLGVAAAAGIAYLAYKLYRAHSDGSLRKIVDKFMADLRATAPGLFKIPGWFESVANDVMAHVRKFKSENNPTALINYLANVKSQISDKQSTIGPVGAGINICKYKSHNGAGIKIPK